MVVLHTHQSRVILKISLTHRSKARENPLKMALFSIKSYTVIFAVCLDYCWSFSPTFLCGDDKIMSEYWWSERIFRRRCALGRAGLDLSCLACHSLRLLSDSIVDPWRVQAYQWRRVCVASGVNSRQSHHSSYFIFRIFIDFFLSCFIYQIWVKARNIFITQIG